MQTRYRLVNGVFVDRHGNPMPTETDQPPRVVAITLDFGGESKPQRHPQAGIPNSRRLPGDSERYNPRSKRRGLRTH